MRKQNHESDRLGDILLAADTITEAQLAEAVARQRAGDGRPLGEVLVALGHVTSEDIELALLRQQARRGEMKAADGLRLLDRAEECARRIGGSIDELASAAAELGGKTR
jgi:hypothetical protein